MQATLPLRFLDPHEFADDDRQIFAADVLEGFSRKPKSISSKYFYDDRGSDLFQKITAMPEYYLTRCEFEILSQHREKICQLVTEGEQEQLHVIELGAGDGHKTFLLLEQMQEASASFEYNPIDISSAALETLVENMADKFSDKIPVEGIVSDYFQGLSWLKSQKNSRNFVLFLGSNIGNFSLTAAQAFMRRLWHSLKDGDLVLTGFDLKKDVDPLMKAYSDPHGITGDFNLNLLTRMNRELGANFDIGEFQHHAYYNPVMGAMESYLISRCDQQIGFKEINRVFDFDKAEPIHTEFSYKYHIGDIEKLAQSAGFSIVDHFFDEREYFVDSLWRVEK